MYLTVWSDQRECRIIEMLDHSPTVLGVSSKNVLTVLAYTLYKSNSYLNLQIHHGHKKPLT